MINEPIIVTAAFILFVVLIYKPTKNVILKFLNHKVKEAIMDIENAAKLRKEAENYFKLAQENLLEAKLTSLNIITRAEERANQILANVEDEIKIIAEKKATESLVRINQHELQIINELKSQAVELAMEYVQESLISELDKGAQMNLIENSLRKTKEILH